MRGALQTCLRMLTGREGEGEEVSQCFRSVSRVFVAQYTPLPPPPTRRTHPLAHSFAAAAPSPARARPLAPSVFYTRTVMSASLKLRGGPEGGEGALRWEATGRTIIIGLQSRK